MLDSSFQKRNKRQEKNFTRKRKLSFANVFSRILKLIKRSLPIECELLEEMFSVSPASKQAFSKARYNIKSDGFKELLDHEIESFYERINSGKWRKHIVIAADGSTLRLPDTEEIVEKFGRMRPNGTSGKMPPKARVSMFVDIISSFILNARIANYSIGEETLAKEQLPEVVGKIRSISKDKMLFVYDRGYTSQSFIKQHQDLKVDFLFRLQRGTYKDIWKKVDDGVKDFNIQLQAKHKKGFCYVRVVALTLPDGTKEVLITSLLNKNEYSTCDIAKVYFLRWHIEECYKRLKITAELENFSGKSVEAILQEFWSHIVMCNIVSVYMFDVQGGWNIDNIPDTRLSFSLLFAVIRDKLFKVLNHRMSIKTFEKYFYRAIPRAKIKIRPRRSYSRAKVDMPKRHHVFRRVC